MITRYNQCGIEAQANHSNTFFQKFRKDETFCLNKSQSCESKTASKLCKAVSTSTQTIERLDNNNNNNNNNNELIINTTATHKNGNGVIMETNDDNNNHINATKENNIVNITKIPKNNVSLEDTENNFNKNNSGNTNNDNDKKPRGVFDCPGFENISKWHTKCINEKAVKDVPEVTSNQSDINTHLHSKANDNLTHDIANTRYNDTVRTDDVFINNTLITEGISNSNININKKFNNSYTMVDYVSYETKKPDNFQNNSNLKKTMVCDEEMQDKISNTNIKLYSSEENNNKHDSNRSFKFKGYLYKENVYSHNGLVFKGVETFCYAKEVFETKQHEGDNCEPNNNMDGNNNNNNNNMNNGDNSKDKDKPNDTRDNNEHRLGHSLFNSTEDKNNLNNDNRYENNNGISNSYNNDVSLSINKEGKINCDLNHHGVSGDKNLCRKKINRDSTKFDNPFVLYENYVQINNNINDIIVENGTNIENNMNNEKTSNPKNDMFVRGTPIEQKKDICIIGDGTYNKPVEIIEILNSDDDDDQVVKDSARSPKEILICNETIPSHRFIGQQLTTPQTHHKEEQQKLTPKNYNKKPQQPHKEKEYSERYKAFENYECVNLDDSSSSYESEGVLSDLVFNKKDVDKMGINEKVEQELHFNDIPQRYIPQNIIYAQASQQNYFQKLRGASHTKYEINAYTKLDGASPRETVRHNKINSTHPIHENSDCNRVLADTIYMEDSFICQPHHNLKDMLFTKEYSRKFTQNRPLDLSHKITKKNNQGYKASNFDYESHQKYCRHQKKTPTQLESFNKDIFSTPAYMPKQKQGRTKAKHTKMVLRSPVLFETPSLNTPYSEVVLDEKPLSQESSQYSSPRWVD